MNLTAANKRKLKYATRHVLTENRYNLIAQLYAILHSLQIYLIRT